MKRSDVYPNEQVIQMVKDLIYCTAHVEFVRTEVATSKRALATATEIVEHYKSSFKHVANEMKDEDDKPRYKNKELREDAALNMCYENDEFKANRKSLPELQEAHDIAWAKSNSNTEKIKNLRVLLDLCAALTKHDTVVMEGECKCQKN